MSDGYETVTARCLCGVARHQLELAKAELPLRLSICHCHSCRHMTGTLGLTFIQLAPDYAPGPAVLANLTAFPFSKRLTQYFCSTCGTLMLSHYWKDGDDRSKGEQWDAMTGTLEQADGIFELQRHEFVADTLDGGQADFLPSVNDKAISRWAGWPGKSEELPLYWTSPERALARGSLEGRVHAHCKCGGVQFWIARPSERSKQASCPWPDLIIPDHSTEARPAPAAWWLRDGGRKFFAGVCACNSCRLDTGMEWMPWAFVPAIDITLDAEGEVPFSLPFGTLRAYTSSPHVVRYHCGTCGASVFFTHGQRDGLIDVAVGLLDAVEGARAESLLEFTTKRLSFREDGVLRAKDLTVAVENGLSRFAARNETAKDAA